MKVLFSYIRTEEDIYFIYTRRSEKQTLEASQDL